MGAKDNRPDEVREQVARVMRMALEILGSRQRLAERLGAEPALIEEWMTCLSDAPDEAVHAAVEIILEYRKP